MIQRAHDIVTTVSHRISSVGGPPQARSTSNRPARLRRANPERAPPEGQKRPQPTQRRTGSAVRCDGWSQLACHRVGAQCLVMSETIKWEGGRWKAVFRLRLRDGSSRMRNPGEPVKQHGGAIGVDLGLKHLVTLDRPIPGLTDEHGHVPNPRVLERHLARLGRLDRAIARCEKTSKNRAKLLRRARSCTARSPRHASCTSTS